MIFLFLHIIYIIYYEFVNKWGSVKVMKIAKIILNRQTNDEKSQLSKNLEKFVVKQSFVLRMNFCVTNPPLR